MVKVDENYFIEVDSLNYTVKYDTGKKVEKKDGTVGDGNTIITVGYFSSFSNALEGILKHKVRKSMSDTEKSLETALKDVYALINEFNKRVDDIKNL